jgi:hypothetical protein
MKEGICLKLQGGTWQEILSEHLTPLEKLELRNSPQSTLLSAIQLQTILGAKRTQHLVSIALSLNILVEIDVDGKRRCMFVEDERRCKNYSSGGICMNHAVKVQNYSNHFKSQHIRDAHEKFRKDPRRLSLDGDLAILRVLLTQTINLTTNAATGQMGLQGIQTSTVLVDKIRAMVESISSISKLTPEYVDNLLNKVIEAATEFIDPTRLEEFAARVQSLMLLEPEPDVPIEEGTEIEIDGEKHTVEVEAPTKEENLQARALLKQYGSMLPPDELEALKKHHGITDLNC